jgi:hypothetical protein
LPDADLEWCLVLGALVFVLRALGPEFGQSFNEGLGVLAFDDGGATGPGGLGDAGAVAAWSGVRAGAGARVGTQALGGAGHGEVDGEGEVGGPEVGGAEAHGGLMEELVEDGPGAVDGAHFRREDVGLGDGFLVLEDGVVEVFALEPVPEFFTGDAVPDGAHAVAAEG